VEKRPQQYEPLPPLMAKIKDIMSFLDFDINSRAKQFVEGGSLLKYFFKLVHTDILTMNLPCMLVCVVCKPILVLSFGLNQGSGLGYPLRFLLL
jgi:hypothetical protein